MHFKRLLLSLLLIQVCMGKEEIQHNLPEGVELVDPKSLGLNSDIDLDKLLGNVKLLPIGGNDLSKQTGLKTQILTVGFDGDENINLDDFELPPLPDSKSSEKPIAEAAFKSFKDFFKNPNKSVSFEEGTKTQLTKEIQEYGTKTGKILSSPKSNFEYVQSSHAPTTTTGQTKVESQSQNHNSQQRPSGTLRRRIKKPKTTTTTVPPQQRQTAQPSQSSKTTVAIEPPAANSFNQFDLPNYGLPAGQSPKVIELGQEQIEKLLAQGKLTKSSGPGPQVIELGEEQLEDLLRQHSQDIVKTNSPSQNQNKVQHSPSVTTTTAATTAKPQTYLTSSRPITESPRIQEVIKQGQIYQPPQANVIHQSNYQENNKVINLQTNNAQFTSNRAVPNNDYRQGNTVGNQLVPVYKFSGSNNNQQSQPQIVTNNPHLQHGFQPILQPSNLISPQQNQNQNQNSNNGHFQQQFQQPQQQQQQQFQQPQQQQPQQQQQHQQQHHQQQQHQQQQQQYQQQRPHQQQQQQHQQQQNIQSNHNSFEVISAPPVSFSTSSEPINKGNGGNININAQQEHQRIIQQQQQQQHNSNVHLQQQQQAFHNQQHNININQFRNVVQNSQPQSSQQAPQTSFNPRPNPNENAKNNVRPTQNTVQQKPLQQQQQHQQQQQQSNVQSQQNSNNHVMNIVRPPIQTQRIITPSPYVLHQVLNQIPTSFNPTLNVKHIVNSPILDPSAAFRQDPLPHQQQLFAQNHNRQPTGQIHFPGGQNPRARPPSHHRDQLVATSNHPDAYKFGQNFNIQLGPVRQSQVIGQFTHPFHQHRNLAGI